MIKNLPFNEIAKRIAKFCYLFGIACLLVGISLSAVQFAGEMGAVNAQGQGNCDTDWVEKDGSAPFGYTGSETIIKVIVKSGQGCFPLTIGSPSDGCYQATGLGSSSVSVTRIGTPGPQCQAISHAEFYAGPTDPPVTTEPPGTTEPPPATTEIPATTDPPATTQPPVATDPPATTEPPSTTEPPTITEIPATTQPPASTQPPATTEPPTATDPPENVTPTEPVLTPSPPPTLPPPADTPELVLIPETGVDLSLANYDFDNRFMIVFFLGLGFVGIGLVFHGVSKRRTP